LNYFVLIDMKNVESYFSDIFLTDDKDNVIFVPNRNSFSPL
jgi:hypothetical protein